jgi:ABC-type uncharacterized transport system substrate-binding protein
MKRRQFITLVGGAAAAWPLVARAQQPIMPRVGFMNILSPEIAPLFVPAFQQGLKEQGFVENQNLAVEYRWAHGDYNQLPVFVADFVRQKIAVIAATGGQPSPQYAMAATQTIPVVFTTNGDPVREGLGACAEHYHCGFSDESHKSERQLRIRRSPTGSPIAWNEDASYPRRAMSRNSKPYSQACRTGHSMRS